MPIGWQEVPVLMKDLYSPRTYSNSNVLPIGLREVPVLMKDWYSN